jgi:hypothetical protein
MRDLTPRLDPNLPAAFYEGHCVMCREPLIDYEDKSAAVDCAYINLRGPRGDFWLFVVAHHSCHELVSKPVQSGQLVRAARHQLAEKIAQLN